MTGRWPLDDPEAPTLRQRTAAAVTDPDVPARIARAVDRFGSHRAEGLGELHDPDGLRHAARAVKASILDDLPNLVERLEERLTAQGAIVHRAHDAAAARTAVVRVAGGRRVVKSKSMATEEIGLNEALEAAGSKVTETDLGEWIIQLAEQTPSHIIAPAVHHDRHSILEVFERVAGAHGVAAEPEALNAFARERLRAEFLSAEVGITGANFAVVDSGSIVLVTNEGNGRLTTSLPPVHVVVLGTERLVRTWEELDLFLTLLTRSATGQRLTSYTSAITGPRRAGEADGPAELHVVILDNGRLDLLDGPYTEMLGCLRCGACLNVCPVYRQTGGHAYGWVYPGPMGAVLTALGHGSPEAAELPGASTLCGACMDACPVEIPLQDLLLSLRRRRVADRSGRGERAAWRAWSEAWSRPATFRATTEVATRAGSRLGSTTRFVPGARRWTEGREAPVPAGRPFRDRWTDLTSAEVGRLPVAPSRPGAEVPETSPLRSPRPPLAHDGHARRPPVATREVPEIGYRVLDGDDDLLTTFKRTATEAGARVTIVDDDSTQLITAISEIVGRHRARAVVTDGSHIVGRAADGLATTRPDLSIQRGDRAMRADRAAADIGITRAEALIAATGSVVIDTGSPGDRTTSLLPRVHVVVTHAEQVVATPGEVWRRYDSHDTDLPSNLVMVTGPSRTGDIEQLLTIGVHGPGAVEIVVITASS